MGTTGELQRFLTISFPNFHRHDRAKLSADCEVERESETRGSDEMINVKYVNQGIY